MGALNQKCQVMALIPTRLKQMNKSRFVRRGHKIRKFNALSIMCSGRLFERIRAGSASLAPAIEMPETKPIF
jgi:hypothetical protein